MGHWPEGLGGFGLSLGVPVIRPSIIVVFPSWISTTSLSQRAGGLAQLVTVGPVNIAGHRAPPTEEAAQGTQGQLEVGQRDLRRGLFPELVQPILWTASPKAAQRQRLGATGVLGVGHGEHGDDDGGAVGGAEGRGLRGGGR